jgi:benzoylformate decarboxylase
MKKPPAPKRRAQAATAKPASVRTGASVKARAPKKTRAPDAAMTVQEAVLRFMREHGMTTLFGNPGSTELPMFRTWPDEFRYVLGLQEASVVSMADGYAQVTHNAACINLHSAAGVGHALGAIYTAYKNCTPLVITAGQQARSLLPYDPFLGATRAAEFPQPYVKFAVEPARAEDVPAALARAYAVAMSAPQGPTFVSVPVDDWGVAVEPVPPRQIEGRPVPAPAALEELGRRIDAAKSPVFVVGPEVDRLGAFETVVALAERYEAPVWGSPMASRASFPESHRLFAGHLRAQREAVHESLEDADLIVVLGAPAFMIHIHTDGPSVPDADIVQLIADPQVGAFTPKGLTVVGDVKAGIDALLARASGPKRPRGQGREAIEPFPPADPIPIAYVVELLDALRPADSVVFEEAPSARPILQRRFRFDRPESFFATTSGCLGFGLAGAVGAALGRPDRRTIALIGDGSMLYTIQSLWTAAQFKVPLTVVVVNNGGYYALKHLARLFNAPAVGSDIPGIDMVMLAEAQGVPGVRVTEAADLERAMTRALAADGPSLIDVIVDPVAQA